MKLRTIVKIAITSSVVLLCSGFALYSFFRLSAAEDQKDFDLYTLVPSSAFYAARQSVCFSIGVRTPRLRWTRLVL